MPIGGKNLEDRNEFLTSIFKEYNRRIYGYVVRLINDRTEAEDVLQDVFLRAARGLKGENEDKTRRWLYKVATNLAVDRLRRRRFKMVSIDHPSGNATLERTLENNSPQPDVHLYERERNRALDDAIAVLPLEQKEVVLLRHFSGLSFKEISKVTGCPLGTVLSRMHRALGKLRKEIEKEHGPLGQIDEGDENG
jgi:RNA polymerase sigma-70 factor (ECF subfamily)